jgi:transmembrane sensor
MSERDTGTMHDQAIAWMIRTRDADFADWDGFADWLESDPDRARHYDALMSADEQIAAYLGSRPTQLPTAPAQVRWRLYGGAFAAALAVVTVALPTLTRPTFVPQTIASRAGQKLVVRLGDGSRIDLNGATRLVLDGPRHVRLERGEALFTILHEHSRPFEVSSGDAVVRDVGTTFNLVRTPQSFTATVSEGEIVFNPDRENVSVQAGREVREEGDRVTVSAADIAAVGAWRTGKLIYRGVPIERIADDLSRGLGLAVVTDRSLADRPFSGIIQIDGRGEAALRSAAATLGLGVRRSGKAWVLVAN